MPEIIIYLAIGFVLLYFGAEWLVKGACNIAFILRISQLIVGLTVVSFGTSAPELIVSLKAGISGHGDISIGNVVGSNIVNICFILGLAAMINPLRIDDQILKFDLIVCIAASIVFWIFILDGVVSRAEGFVLFAMLLAYVTLLLRISLKDKEKLEPSGAGAETKVGHSVPKSMLLLVAGLAALVGGAHLFVEGAVKLAKLLKVSEAVIGLTVVAVGTSLPELAASVVAAVKKKDDISVGNIIGSNIFNICCIIGLVSMIAPIEAKGVNSMDFAFMLGSALVLFPIMFTGKIITRLEGLFLVIIYVVYVGMLWPKG